MKKQKLFFKVAAAALLLSNGAFMSAQVTVGSEKIPETYSLLELVSNHSNGLRLPQMTTAQRDAMADAAFKANTKAQGLRIFNTTTRCVETWNGTVWITECEPPVDPSTVTTPGDGTLVGRVCFDIDESNTDNNSCGSQAARLGTQANFAAVSDYTYTFTASATGTVKNVRYVVQETADLLIGTQGTAYLYGKLEPDNMANGDSRTLTLNFRNTLNNPSSPVYGLTRDQAAHVTINIIYFDGTEDVKIYMTLNIQDCICGCSVKSTLTAPPYNGWLTFMCYNLGAKDMSITEQMNYTTTSTADSTVYGNLYQWGRIADGHQFRNSQSYLTNGTGSQSSPVADANLDANGQVKSTFTAYGKFIKNNVSPKDWHVTRNDNLWDFSIYPSNNPCPEGWRVPTQTEVLSIINGDTIQVNSILAAGYTATSGNKWVWSNTPTPGCLITPSGSNAPTLFLPAAGVRNADDSSLTGLGLAGVGLGGYYWWSTPRAGGYTNRLQFTNSGMQMNWDSFRANGFSVRCVTE